MTSSIQIEYYPGSEEIPRIAKDVADIFRQYESNLSTIELSQEDRPKSNEVLEMVRPGLEKLGFQVEGGEQGRIYRAILKGKHGEPKKAAEVDGFHKGKRCVLEVEGEEEENLMQSIEIWFERWPWRISTVSSSLY
ncbi:hypothetical protein ACFQS4_01645 [Saliphagus sp. GCM10025317]